MSSDQDMPAGDGPRPRSGRDSLGHALDDLESMLGRHRSPDEAGAEGEDEETGAAEQTDDTDDDQYNIPLLSDVVLPAASGATPGASRVPLDSDYEEAVERMTERLASEVDVIVQSAVEEAVDLLRRDIGERLREHIEITLPEILEELVQQRQNR